MQLSKRGVKQDTEKQILDFLYQAVADMKTRAEVQEFLSDILTDVELMTVAKRLAIAWHLEKGSSYEDIHQELKVSSATIAGMQTKMSERSGIRQALRKIEAEQWANKWTARLMRMLGMKNEEYGMNHLK